MQPFTLTDYTQVEPIVLAAERNATITYVKADGTGAIKGTARRLCQENGAMAGRTDVRDLMLQVTVGGTEVLVPVRYLMTLVNIGGLAVDRA